MIEQLLVSPLGGMLRLLPEATQICSSERADHEPPGLPGVCSIGGEAKYW